MSKAKQQELDENELAVWLNKVNSSIEPYSKPIAIVVGALIIGGVFWGLYDSKVTGDRSDATLQLLMNDPEVSDKYPGTSAAAWSLLYTANTDLDAGIQSLYTNRDDAETLLTQAKSTFEKSLDSSDDGLLRSRAYLGIALACESLGDLDGAITAYNDCINENESNAMVQKAETRIKELSDPEIKSFVAWFGEQDFAPADPSTPPELPGGSTLPDLPDLKLSPLLSGEDDENGEDGMELGDAPGDIELPKDADGADESKAEAKEGLELPKAEGAEANESKGDSNSSVKKASQEASEKK